MRKGTGQLRLRVATAILILVFAQSSFALYTVEGFGRTPQEAMDMAKSNGMDAIASRNGEGCLGRKEGGLIKSTREEGGMLYVEIYVSEHAGSCGQKMNSVNIFGQEVKF